MRSCSRPASTAGCAPRPARPMSKLGDENDGPRGRIQLMRLVSEDGLPLSDRMRRHLELCLDCRACETACPSGVRYGQLIEPFRLAAGRDDDRIERRFDIFREMVLLRLFPYAERIAAAAGPGAAAAAAGRLRRGRAAGAVPPRARPAGDACCRCCRRRQSPGPKLPWFLPAVGGRARGWPSSSAAWPTRCFAPRTGQPSASCSRTAATSSCRPDKDAAARSTSTPATAAAPGRWPTPISSPSNWTATTPSWSITAAAGRC